MTPSPFSASDQSSRDVVMRSFGGPMGIVESVVPGVVFVLVQTITQQVVIAALWTAVPIVGFAVWRAIRTMQGHRSSWTSLITGLFGAAIGLIFALTTRNATTNYLPGITYNAVTLVLFVGSIAARWPWMGIVVGIIAGDFSGWRQSKALMRSCTIATWIWCAGTALRVGIMFTLYLAAQHTQSVVALGIAKLLLGLPLLAIELVLTWIIVRPAYVLWHPTQNPPDAERGNTRTGVDTTLSDK